MPKVLFANSYSAQTSVILRLKSEESPLPKDDLCRLKILRLTAAGGQVRENETYMMVLKHPPE